MAYELDPEHPAAENDICNTCGDWRPCACDDQVYDELVDLANDGEDQYCNRMCNTPNCVIPDPFHSEAECVTAEMMDDYYAEAGRG